MMDVQKVIYASEDEDTREDLTIHIWHASMLLCCAPEDGFCNIFNRERAASSTFLGVLVAIVEKYTHARDRPTNL